MRDEESAGMASVVEEGRALEALPPRTRRRSIGEPEEMDVLVVGAGQAGLSVGYHLARRGIRNFLILDANTRVGDSWRQRWDSLRLFTPARYDGLDGMRFPAPARSFPTKDEMANYLESYARRFLLPVRNGRRVDGLSRDGDRFLVSAGTERFVAREVVVAMASYQKAKVPSFAQALSPSIVHLHSSEYRTLSQLRPGRVLVVGAGNSGAEIAVELRRAGHPVALAGRDVGEVPGWLLRPASQALVVPLLFRGIFHRLLTESTPPGRRAKARQHGKGTLLIRTLSRHLAAAGVERVGRVRGVEDGRPVLEDGTPLEVNNVVWCTGFHPGFAWVHLPVLDDHGEPRQRRGVVADVPGLYFVGLHFLYAMSSTMIHGVGRDARFVAERVAARLSAARPLAATARAA